MLPSGMHTLRRIQQEHSPKKVYTAELNTVQGSTVSRCLSSSLPFCRRNYTGFKAAVTRHAATLDTEPPAKSYSGGSRTQLFSNHFQYARACFCSWLFLSVLAEEFSSAQRRYSARRATFPCRWREPPEPASVHCKARRATQGSYTVRAMFRPLGLGPAAMAPGGLHHRQGNAALCAEDNGAGSITDSCSPLQYFLSALREPWQFKLVVLVASGRDGLGQIKAPGVKFAACLAYVC